MKNMVRKFRREQEISQEELAKRAKTSRQTIVNLENVEGYAEKISLGLGFRIAKALGQPLGEIFLASPVKQVRQKTG